MLIIHSSARTKRQILKELTQLMTDKGVISDTESFLEDVYQRRSRRSNRNRTRNRYPSW
ncbi:PTS sugar transporter subunit IIA [Enterococcus lactis]|nr:PTS sugar transporter subunit IIA [Enterococcus lactis]